MDIKPSAYSTPERAVKIPNWHLAKEFVSSNSTMDSLWPSLSDMSEDCPILSLSSDFDYSFVNMQLSSLPQLCLSKEGSIRAQQFLSKARPEHLTQAIQHISPSLFELTLDPYANYAMQTLFQSCSASQRLLLLNSLSVNLTDIARHPKGTHALQTLISLCSSNEEEEIYAGAFKGKVLELSLHNNASHVIQKLLSTIKNRYFLIKELIGHAKELAVDKTGLCVIKRALNDPQIFSELSEDLLTLMQDPYGNYAIQILVEMWMEELSFTVICAIKGKAAQLCIQKYASNVIEKCLKEESMRNFIVDELVTEDKIKVLLASPYGCYVLRTTVKCADLTLKRKLQPYVVAAMNNTSYKTLKARWEEIIMYFG